MMKVNIIGCGVIGGVLLEDMSKAKVDDIHGTDVNPELIKKLNKQGYNVSNEICEDCDIYIISVLTTDQVIDVINKIDYSKNPLVVIESTIIPGTAVKILEKRDFMKLVIFPHRFYDKDPTKRVFNLDRVMGAKDEQTMKEAMQFYGRYMDTGKIYPTDLKTAEICKPIENTIRYVEIALAEGLKISLLEKGYDFEAVRKACNTKWNINLMQAMDGIGGHCLPKDIKIMDEFFNGNFILKASMDTDCEYRQMVKRWNQQKARK
jgi:UDP-N-acetyl-D-mannosaminuronic acid dehydrogenase